MNMYERIEAKRQASLTSVLHTDR